MATARSAAPPTLFSGRGRGGSRRRSRDRRRYLAIAVVVVAVALGGVVANLVAGNTPQLGLDLQGGASVVLQPRTEVPSATLDEAIAIIRTRVDALGVAEPEIVRQGDTVVVSLPGVKDQDRALEVVGRTAELRFRPVLGTEPAPAEPPPAPEAPPSPDAEVVLPGLPGGESAGALYRLGPSELGGEAVADARARFESNQWAVVVDLTDDGSRRFDDLAERHVGSQVAIVLDGVVQSAPRITTSHYGGRARITGSFTQEQAEDLALVLRYGALPVDLEPQTVQTISPTLGRDVLHAGIVAGVVGLVLVAGLLLGYYRLLGLVALAGLGVAAALLWSIVTLLGATRGLALTIAGVTGIIVSVGTMADSSIVYFEVLKEELGVGRTVPRALVGGFRRAFRTIVAADAVSFIASALLYTLTVGPVRGFALFLGLATVLDVVVAWCFLRPAVLVVAHTPWLVARPRLLGLGTGTTPTGAAAERPERLRTRLHRQATSFDFQRWRRLALGASALLVVVSVVSFATRGLHLGIEFEGGTAWEVPAPSLSTAQARDALAPYGLASARVQVLGGDTVRVQAGPQEAARRTEVVGALASAAGVPVSEVSTSQVGPSWGADVSSKAQRALVWFLVAISAYIALRFEWRMAVAALVAVAHDVALSVGAYSVLGLEVTPATVVAFLTILGYSLYDTIVVFDKVRENGLAMPRARPRDVVNRSMNQVLMRSVNTSVTSVMPVVSLLVVGAGLLGAVTLEQFALALLVGMLAGVYSSLFVASPLFVLLSPDPGPPRRRAATPPARETALG